jgi:hypothetical protein
MPKICQHFSAQKLNAHFVLMWIFRFEPRVKGTETPGNLILKPKIKRSNHTPRSAIR